jgi:glutamate dehydrogenase (NAD(P)+)
MADDSISVLLIEDNPIHARLFEKLLADVEHPSFKLETADTLAAGMERLERGGIDVLLLDLVLPDSRELETVERVRAADPTFLSSFSPASPTSSSLLGR